MTRLSAEYTLTIGGAGTGTYGYVPQAFKSVNLGVKSPSLEFHILVLVASSRMLRWL